ncbi:MAG: MBL fold metallo-hydrolase, partial [Firmicutes bacterium]|nr:MBL fold metallo-hydrolase [Bacillota bacterium]
MNDWLKITAIDVGKGDCILLQRGDHAVLIDTGYEDTAGKVLGELGAAGVKKLEALILTHFHKDHIGGVSAVLK